MTDIRNASVAHILLGPCSDMNFAHVVGEMQRTLTDCLETVYSLEWKEDDIAIFDLEATRIVFAVESYERRDEMNSHYSGCLMVSVGPPVSGRASLLPHAPHDRLCQLIARRIGAVYEVVEVIWRETDIPMTGENIETLLLDVPVPEAAERPAAPDTANVAQPDYAEDVIPLRAPRSSSVEATDKPVSPPKAERLQTTDREINVRVLSEYQNLYHSVANSVPDLKQVDIARLSAIRAALYAREEGDGPEVASAQTRLAVTAMDVTMVMVCLPVGAAMLTYHVLKGGELRRCAQMLTLTGLFMSGANSAVAQQLISYF